MSRPKERNFDHVQFADLRREIDPIFNELHDALEEAYYGERDPETGRFVPGTGWRNGQSKPFLGFDKQATPEESKALFDRLHGMLFHARNLTFHQANLQRQEPYDRALYDRRGQIAQARAALLIDKQVTRAIKAQIASSGLSFDEEADD